MAFEKASLKLVFMTDIELENGNGYKMKSKTFSNVREGANADDLNAVAEALESLQKYSLEERYQVITNRIG